MKTSKPRQFNITEKFLRKVGNMSNKYAHSAQFNWYSFLVVASFRNLCDNYTIYDLATTEHLGDFYYNHPNEFVVTYEKNIVIKENHSY